MDYFYTSPENIEKKKIIIDAQEFKHLTHVMRKKEGDFIRVVDGKGNAYDVILKEISAKKAIGEITGKYSHHNEPSLSVTLGIGILKNPSKFDFLVEKVTEIGVNNIIPLITARTIPSHAKIDRWQKLALSAMKQCGRSYLPQIHELIKLPEFLQFYTDYDLKLVAHQEGNEINKIESFLKSSVKSAVMLIGPEGGFEENEIERCIQSGFVKVSFGCRRLRTETAAIVAATSILL